MLSFSESKIAFITDRLEAHFLTPQNQQLVIDLYNADGSTEYLEGLDVLKDLELVRKCYQENQNVGSYLFFSKKNNEFIGFGGVQNQESLDDGSLALSDKIEFLIMVGSKHAGLGYGYEFSSAFLRFFFDNFPKISVPARVNKENFACIKLLRKLGFSSDGDVAYRDWGTKFNLLRINFDSI